MLWTMEDCKSWKLSESIRRSLAVKFSLADMQAAKMLSLETGGHQGTKRVKKIRIYDPDLVQGGENLLKKFEQLDQQLQALLFEGHVDGEGFVILNDVRRPAQATA
jgi:hypothetical protein